jgi:hypothetical protein
MSTPRKVKTTFYAQVKPKFGRRYDTVQGYIDCVDSIQVTTITQKKPVRPQSGCHVVKLTIQLSEGVFMPLMPAAIIDIPDSAILANDTIEVEAVDENDGKVAEYLAASLRGK